MTTILANPAVRINNVTVAIVPNSLKIVLGRGEVTTRAASSGGNSIEMIHAVDAESKVSEWTFDLYPKAVDIKSIPGWKDSVGANAISAVETVDGVPLTFSLAQASLTNDPEIQASADGVISLTWRGAQTVIG